MYSEKVNILLLPCSSYFTVIFKLLLLTLSKEFRSCISRFFVRNFWILLLFHFMQWHLMLQVYINLFIFAQYTALDLVLCLVVQTSSFWWSSWEVSTSLMQPQDNGRLRICNVLAFILGRWTLSKISVMTAELPAWQNAKRYMCHRNVFIYLFYIFFYC